jgi:hypothetical protein
MLQTATITRALCCNEKVVYVERLCRGFLIENAGKALGRKNAPRAIEDKSLQKLSSKRLRTMTDYDL